MRVTIVVCVVIEEDRDQSLQAAACRNPLKDLLQRMREEVQHGRESYPWRKPNGAQVA